MPVDFDESAPSLGLSSGAGELAEQWTSSEQFDALNAPAESGGSDSFADFMSSIEESVMRMVRESSKAPENLREHWAAFSSAVDWQENWIRGLLAFHVVLLTLVVLTRKDANLQTMIFVMTCAMVLLAERLNAFCAAHWMLFSKQNYFDDHGVFAGVVYAGPLLLICLFQLVSNCLSNSMAVTLIS